jgi:hypothetical protein
MTKHSLEVNKEDKSAHVSCQDQSVHVGDDVLSYVQLGSNAPNSKIVNSCSRICNLARITSAPCKNTRATNNGIWISFHLAYAKRCEVNNQSLHYRHQNSKKHISHSQQAYMLSYTKRRIKLPD